MKTKIVLWGTDEQDKKLLIAIELLAQENKVRILTFPEEEATEEFYNQMMNLWRNGNAVIIPENHQHLDRELSVTENLLPDNIKADRTDLINRAKTEWHFVVLSAKLYESFRSEVEELSTRINELTHFDEGIWEEMKAYWTKVQSQVREENLFREHSNELRNSTNKLFDRMKELKKKLDHEFQDFSKERAEHFSQILKDVEDRIEKGLGLQPIFNELKNIQKNFNDTKFTREDRNKVWKRMDKAFKTIKEKRFGTKGKDKSALDRLTRRYDGLIAAIKKMERSIQRDQSDIDFQIEKIDTTDGQLEMQIRQAKLKMIEERIRSKREKLTEMLKTREELDSRMAKEKEREAAKAAKAEEKAKAKAEGAPKVATEAPQDKTEAGTEEKAEQADEKDNEKPKEENLLGAIGTTLGESLEDVVDTVKAVAEVVSDKVEEKIDLMKKDKKEEAPVASEAPAGEEAEAKEESILDKISAKVDEAIEKGKEVAEKVADKVEEKIEEIKSDKEEETPVAGEAPAGEGAGEGAGEKEDGILDKISAKVDEAIEKGKEVAEKVADKVEEKIEEIKSDKEEETPVAGEAPAGEGAEEKEESILDKISAKVDEAIDTVKDVAEKVADKVEDKIEEIKSDKEEETPVAGEAPEAEAADTKEEGILDKLSAKMDEAIDTAKEAAEKLADKVEEVKEAREKAAKEGAKTEGAEKEGFLGSISAKLGDVIEEVSDSVKTVAETVTEKVEEAMEELKSEEEE